MRAAIGLLAALSAASLLGAEEGRRLEAPSYSTASVVNAATNLAGALAPNTIATIYGANLAFTTRAMSPDDLRGGMLPTVLAGTGVRVLIANIPAHIFFVSPSQVNVLIPGNLRPGTFELQLTLDGRAGPSVSITLARAAPALFQLDPTTAVATHADGSVITEEAPARPGEVVVLYATGLGETSPNPGYGEVPKAAAPIQRISELRILLNDVAVAAEDVQYAGVTPGFAGLYQINLKLPESLGSDPEVRIALGDEISRAGIHLTARPVE